jgi:hypothetical protein
MVGRRIEKIETAIGVAAAASLAAAAGFAGYRITAGLTTSAGMVIVSAASAIIAYLAGQYLFRIFGGEPKPFPQPIFEIAPIAPVPLTDLGELVLGDADRLDELVLGDADRLDELVLNEADRLDDPPLMLEDVLASVEPDSRVVQLFDPAAMPTPGQLKARIDRHLDGGTPHFPSPDASEALFAALADLRRSLR